MIVLHVILEVQLMGNANARMSISSFSYLALDVNKNAPEQDFYLIF